MKKVRKLQFHREIVNIEFDNAINRPPLFSEVPNRQGGAVWYELYGITIFSKTRKYDYLQYGYLKKKSYLTRKI